MKSVCTVSLGVALLMVGVPPATLAGPTIHWGQYATVQSETDGNGLFTYALTAGTDPLTFIMGGHYIFEITFYGMQEIYDTPNWESSSPSANVICWTYTGADPFTLGDTPTVFSAHSTISDAQLWEYSASSPYIWYGLLVGQVAPPDPYPNNMLCGFSFIAPVPEPSTMALFAIGGLTAALVARRRPRQAQQLNTKRHCCQKSA